MIRAFLAAVWLVGTTLAAPACPDPARDARAGWDSAHPLLGRAFDSSVAGLGRIVAQDGRCEPGYAALRDRVGAALNGGVVLLGEIHDNGEHHWWRGALLGDVATAATSRSGAAAVFEHLKRDSPADRLSAIPDLTVDRFFDVTQWADSGWPDASLFVPLIRPLLGRYALIPGDPAVGRVRDVARRGLAALPDTERQRMTDTFQLEQSWPSALQNALLDELEASHCGLVPRTAFGGMALAQRYRDAHLADAIATARLAHRGVVLLTGNGHVRTDRGVPLTLRQVSPTVGVIAIMLIEVVDGENHPAAYVTPTPDGAIPADILIFTPRAQREDPCIAMRAAMGKKP